MSFKFLNLVPLSFGVHVLEEALKSAPYGVLGEALSLLLKGVLTLACGIACCPCVGGGSGAKDGCVSSISSSFSS